MIKRHYDGIYPDPVLEKQMPTWMSRASFADYFGEYYDLQDGEIIDGVTYAYIVRTPDKATRAEYEFSDAWITTEDEGGRELYVFFYKV